MAYGTPIQKNIYYNSPPLVQNLLSSLYGLQERRRRYGRFYHQNFQQLIDSQWFSSTQLEQIQFEKTKAFLENAYSQSPFYHNLFSAYDFMPSQMKDCSDIANLPVINKLTVRNNLNEILNLHLDKYKIHWNRTGGTTGAALKFPESRESFQREYAYRYFQYYLGGSRRGERFAFCVGHPVTYFDKKKPPFWVYDYANNWLAMSSFHLNEKNIAFYIDELYRFKPVLLQGYPSSMYLLAIANQHLGNRVRPRSIFTSSETLFDFQRKTIEDSFGCKVHSYYGNGERCGFIVQCEKGSYHLLLQHSYVEILDANDRPAQPGTDGRLVCTGFGNYATPFVRYDIGDVIALSKNDKCECGRSGPIISHIVGRTDDYVLTSDGRLVGRLSPLFHNAINVRLAQIIQENIDEIIIKIVKEKDYTQKEEADILNQARLRFGSKVKILFEYVDDIPRTSEGKHRFIVSKINKKALFDQILDTRAG